MRCRLQRTRLRPGPLIFIVVAWIVSAPAVARAHDPGLSALDVRVRGEVISVSLAMAPADAGAVGSGGEPEVRQALRQLARSAIGLSLDGEPLRAVDDEVSIGTSGATVRLSFEIGAAGKDDRRLTVESRVPQRMARGHRELLTITVNGRSATEVLLDAESDSATIVLGRSAGPGRAAGSFVILGIHHILSGYDHLVFLAGLLLVARSVRQLLVLLTAFTAAHSVSLALVVAGGVHAPPSIVEPLIAASIAWIGIENLRAERRPAPWFVVFGFGLIHGFGLAGALIDLGLGSSAARIALALLCFNAGVEAGQLAVAAALLPVVRAMRARPAWQAKLVPACSVLIAIAGGYWLIERLSL
jgi:hypothetical protein